MGKLTVALVSMPFAALNLPSIALSLLRGVLRQDGHAVDLFYLNLDFAEAIGEGAYTRIAETPVSILLGEWVFSGAIAGMPADHEYMQQFLPQFLGTGLSEQTLRDIPAVVAQVEPFLAACLQNIDWSRYDVIGFSSVFTQNLATLALAQRLKQQFPHKLIVVGGANVEGVMGRALLKAFPFVDAVCSGEGEVAFAELVRRMAAGEPLSGIQGITLQTDSFEATAGANGPAADMDSLPYVDYDDYFAQLEHKPFFEAIKPNLRILFESSRGCWWGAKSHCTFCGLNGSDLTFRSKSAGRSLAELRLLHEKYRSYSHSISAVDNILDMKYFHEFFPGIKQLGLDLNLFYETKANLTKPQVQALAEAGVHDIQPGIESLSTSVLRLMRKGTTMLQNVQVLKWCREYGVRANWNHLYGFPQESPAEYDRIVADILPAISHLDPPYGCFLLSLDRHSAYFHEPQSHGIQNIRPRPAYRHVYRGIPRELLLHLAGSFEFDHVGGHPDSQYITRLRTAVGVWKETEGSELFSTEIAGSRVIFDLRPAARQTVYRLTEAERLLYEYCDQTRSRVSVQNHLAEHGYPMTTTELSGLIDPLLESLLMLGEGDFLLSLAIPLGAFSPGLAGARRFLAFLDGQAASPGMDQVRM